MEKNVITPKTLYLVATPIGNLSDISERAKKVLSEVDFIAAEDTRVAAKLLLALGLPVKPLVSYYEHNKITSGERIIAELLGGKSCALVSDAGTPAISDPGEDLARSCRERGVFVTAVPGACAAVTALTLSGFDTRRFAFEGFLSAKSDAELAEKAEKLAAEERTLILYEAPHRLEKTLRLLNETFGGERGIALCRELTKLNEEVEITTLSAALSALSDKPPRGEYVLVIEGNTSSDEEKFWENMTMPEHADFYERQGLARMDAIKQVAKDRGIPKNEVYKSRLT